MLLGSYLTNVMYDGTFWGVTSRVDLPGVCLLEFMECTVIIILAIRGSKQPEVSLHCVFQGSCGPIPPSLATVNSLIFVGIFVCVFETKPCSQRLIFAFSTGLVNHVNYLATRMMFVGIYFCDLLKMVANFAIDAVVIFRRWPARNATRMS